MFQVGEMVMAALRNGMGGVVWNRQMRVWSDMIGFIFCLTDSEQVILLKKGRVGCLDCCLSLLTHSI